MTGSDQAKENSKALKRVLREACLVLLQILMSGLILGVVVLKLWPFSNLLSHQEAEKRSTFIPPKDVLPQLEMEKAFIR